MSLNLVGQAPSGAVYRLRDATVTVQGPTSTKVWHTEDDPGRTSLSANVVAGTYSALLGPGWRIERVEGPSTETLPAELVSTNPSAFVVEAQARTAVPLRFRVFDEEVDMGQGYDIVLEVEECAQQDVCGDGVDNDCDGAADCDDSDCAADPTCAPVCGNGVLEHGEACDDGNTADFDGCSGVCQLELPELEPNEDGTPEPFGDPLFGNDFATAAADANGAYTGSVQLLAGLSPAGDEDVFAFENTSADLVSVRFDTWNPALGVGVPCGETIDPAIIIRDATATVIVRNGDRAGAADRCAGLAFVLPPGQRIYVQVMDFGDDAAIAGYALTATYTPL